MTKKLKLKKDIKERFSSNMAVCQKVIDILSLFSNKTRFRILCALAEGDFCVNDLREVVGMGKISNISQQLKLLTLAAVLEKKRDKQQVIYRLTDKRVRQLIDYLKASYMNGETGP
jgi:DNA-binding transcriptional ArsR family regulator